MKKILSLYFLFLLFLSINSIAQKANPTRFETEQWLTEKLNKYVSKSSVDCVQNPFSGGPVPDNLYCLNCTNIKFQFIGNDIIINMDVKKTTNKGESDYQYFKRKVTIPIDHLDNISYLGPVYLTFRTKYSAILVENSNGETSKSIIINFEFRSNSEEDFKVRFEKAMNYLKKFIKKPKSNEAF